MLRKIRILLACVIFSEFCSCYRILVVFPQPNFSHTSLGNALTAYLMKAGHEVTYISVEPPNYDSQKLRFIDISSSVKAFAPGKIFDVQQLIRSNGNILNTLGTLQAKIHVPNATIFNKDVQDLLHDTNEQFDVVVTEWLFSELYFGFATVFDCPLIVVPTFEPIAMFTTLLTESSPAATTNRLTTHDPPFTFWERVTELYKNVYFYFSCWYMSRINNAIFENGFSSAVAKRGRSLPPYSQVRTNISLVLANSHVSTGAAMDLPQNFKQVGGFHISEDITPLPDNLQKIMDNAKHGVVYFSLGTLVRVKDMPDDMRMQLLRVFRGLKQTVIWKSDNPTLRSIDNVFVFDFVLQQSILAHPNCKMFITHGGLLSVTEAIHFGVPIIGVPLFSDQFINVNRAVERGFARKVDANFNMADNLQMAINEILTQPRYLEKMKEHSVIYHHRLVPPGDEIVYWVEHVVKTRGAPHLQAPAKYVPLYQRIYLDLVLLVAVFGIMMKIIINRLKRYMIKFNLVRRMRKMKIY